MSIDAATAVVLGAAISGLCTAITALGVVWITKRSDERRHLREIILRTAIENWKVVDQAAKESRAQRLPLDVYIIHMLKFAEIITKKHITVDDIEKNDRESALVIAAAIKSAERVTLVEESNAE
jgi:hypothetical protein